MNSTPPKFAAKLLEASLPNHLKEPVLGDLEEAFRLKTQNTSLTKARRWYWNQVLTSFVYFINTKEKNMSKRNKTSLFLILVFFVSVTLFYFNMEPYQKERLAHVVSTLMDSKPQ